MAQSSHLAKAMWLGIRFAIYLNRAPLQLHPCGGGAEPDERFSVESDYVLLPHHSSITFSRSIWSPYLHLA